MKKKIVIAGGSGFLGSCITSHFSRLGYEIVILSRSTKPDRENVRFVSWDAKSLGTWSEVLEGAEVLINLTGKSVDCRYTESNKQEIYDSRLDATKVLGEAMKKLRHPPALWINSASATIYRHALDREMDEETGDIGEGFSVDVCQKWEKAFNEIELPNTRQVVLRIGFVLGQEGGALVPLKNLAKMGFGGRQGKGNQFCSWIHERDFVEIIDYVIHHPSIEGTYNVTSPTPIPNRLLMSEFRDVLKIPLGLPIPRWLLTLGAMFIRTETELILKSRRVVPRKLQKAGYQFYFPDIHSALHDLIKT